MNKYPWYILDVQGNIVANFERKDIAEQCKRYFSNNFNVQYFASVKGMTGESIQGTYKTQKN